MSIWPPSSHSSTSTRRRWATGVAGMRAGGKRELHIPAWLGYGAEGAGRVIPPGASLVFEVELLEIRK